LPLQPPWAAAAAVGDEGGRLALINFEMVV
jgi:hypothetical protein